MKELKNMTYGELRGLKKAMEEKGFAFTKDKKKIDLNTFEKSIDKLVNELNKQQNKKNEFYNIPKI